MVASTRVSSVRWGPRWKPFWQRISTNFLRMQSLWMGTAVVPFNALAMWRQIGDCEDRVWRYWTTHWHCTGWWLHLTRMHQRLTIFARELYTYLCVFTFPESHWHLIRWCYSNCICFVPKSTGTASAGCGDVRSRYCFDIINSDFNCSMLAEHTLVHCCGCQWSFFFCCWWE